MTDSYNVHALHLYISPRYSLRRLACFYKRKSYPSSKALFRLQHKSDLFGKSDRGPILLTGSPHYTCSKWSDPICMFPYYVSHLHWFRMVTSYAHKQTNKQNGWQGTVMCVHVLSLNKHESDRNGGNCWAVPPVQTVRKYKLDTIWI